MKLAIQIGTVIPYDQKLPYEQWENQVEFLQLGFYSCVLSHLVLNNVDANMQVGHP